MRKLLPILVVTLACGCASTEYKDTNAKVDANPLCASLPSQPGEVGPPECRRKTSASWTSERTNSTPLDFSGRPKDD